MRALFWTLFLPALIVTASRPAGAQVPGDSCWAALQGNAIVLLRHATAPGIGDPRNFELGDCATQRNLNAQGRSEAVAIGHAFRTHGIRVAAVRSSQWCRTHDTASLAFPGLVEDEPVFNSFFDDASSDPARTAAARAFLLRWKGPGVLVVVTHQVNITALTGIVPGSGAGVVVVPHGDALEIVGRLPAPR